VEPTAKPATRHRRFVASARTNLPRWPTEPPPLDAAGRGFILVALGEGMADVVARWAAATSQPCRQLCDPAAMVTDDLLARFDAALGAAVTGWRLMLAGPASEILLLAARARAAGLIEAEIRMHAVEDGYARAQCAHCKTMFRAQGEPGAHITCPGCDRVLILHQHLSRRLGALVAFSALTEAPR
jgi:predicted RNA-binding Zn-ribbon protein involved in translation (DUF1610 family)